MKVYILLGDVSEIDRVDFENIEGILLSLDNLETMSTSGKFKGMTYYTLSEFMTMCNDEEFNDDNFWVTYVYI